MTILLISHIEMLQNRMAKVVQHHPPHFGQRLILFKKAQGNFGITFHCNFEHDFLHI
jgi:hypothetical protein